MVNKPIFPTRTKSLYYIYSGTPAPSCFLPLSFPSCPINICVLNLAFILCQAATCPGTEGIRVNQKNVVPALKELTF